MFDFSNKKVLVTGGTKGIGKHLVDCFRSSGAEVWYTGRSEDYLNDPYYMNVDFCDREGMGSFLEDVKGVGFDVLINNAGYNILNPVEDYSDEDYEYILSLNLTSCFKVTKAVLPFMKQKGSGRIVNITSISSEITMPHRSAYCSSKFGLVGLTKCCAVEMAKYGVLVNSVGPGVTVTDLTKSVLGEDKMNDFCDKIPMGRLAQVDDVSNLVMFLSSDYNTYVVGQNIMVDGGYTCV
jgi:3-oxoacyl-[acyl-carrier protein] reductase